MTRQRDFPGKRWPPGRGVVHLHSTRKTFPPIVTDLVNEQTQIVEHELLPGSAHFLVTRAALSVRIYRTAARFRALPVVLPEAAEWLRARIQHFTEAGLNVVIVIYSPSDLT